MEELEVKVEVEEAVKSLLSFLADPNAFQLVFNGSEAPILNSWMRQEVHKVAERLELSHESIGEGEFRCLMVSKRFGVPRGDGLLLVEYFYADTYFGIKGAMVDAVAEKYKTWLHPSVWAKREARDGPHHHITILSAASIAQLSDISPPASLFSQLQQAVSDSWCDKGLGMVKDEQGNATFFVIIDWPSASEYLLSIGAEPQTFHITLGFQLNDIHNVPKSIQSQIAEKDLPSVYSMEAIDTAKSLSKKSSKASKVAKASSKSTPKNSDAINDFPASLPSSSSSSHPSSSNPSPSSSNPSPSKPKPALSGHIFWVRSAKPKLQAEHPEASLSDLARMLGSMWQKLTPEEKEPYQQLAIEDKQRFDREMKDFGK